MRILLTGPRGFVGARVMAELRKEYEKTSGNAFMNEFQIIPAPPLRGADQDMIRQLIDRVQPDLIIHTAAMSDISACEKDPDGSYLANVKIPVYLAEMGVKLVAFSTDQVYSGSGGQGPYSEHEVCPDNLYARQKLEMEQRTLQANPDTVLLRASWMYDMPMYGLPNRGNFLVNMLTSRVLSFSSAQYRAVTYVREVARHIMKAASLPGGVYNYGSENDLSMMETARWLKETLSLPVSIQDAGPRHNLWMDCSKAEGFGITFQNTKEGLETCIKDYGLLR